MKSQIMPPRCHAYTPYPLMSYTPHQQSSDEFYKSLPQNLSHLTSLPSTSLRQSNEPKLSNFSKQKRPAVEDDWIPPNTKNPNHNRRRHKHTFYKFLEKFYYDYDRQVGPDGVKSTHTKSHSTHASSSSSSSFPRHNQRSNQHNSNFHHQGDDNFRQYPPPTGRHKRDRYDRPLQ